MKTLRNKLRERKGDLTSSMVSLLIITAAFALVLSALPVFSKVYYLHAYLDDAARYVELTGSVEGIGEVLAELDEKYFPAGDAPQTDYLTGMPFIPGTERIQLGDMFSLTAVYAYDFRLSGFFSIPIRLTARSTGRSEVYFK